MPIILFILFILFAFAVLFFTHFFAYISFIRLFQIASMGFKIFFIVVLVFWPLSFIISSALTHFKLNSFTRAYYFLSSLWLGVGVNIIVAFLVCWAIFFLSRYFSFGFDLRIVYLLLLIISLVYSSYGVWNAFNPQIKNINVKINNLPESWKGAKVVQLSDIHLGHIFGGNFLRDIVTKVNAQNPKAVFITGDLFEGMDGDFGIKIEPLNYLSAKNGVYFITGNHETYFGLDRVEKILEDVDLVQLHDMAVDVDGVLVYGIDSPMEMSKKDVGKIIMSDPLYNTNSTSILLYHTPTNINQAKEAGINLQLSGHSHHGQIWPINLITYLVYGKYHTGLHTEGDYNIYTSNGTGSWGPTMRTGHKPEITVIHFE